MKRILIHLFCIALCWAAGRTSAEAQVPQLLNYQGRIVSNGTNFTGTGQFKSVLLNGAGTPAYWNNSGSNTGTNQPTAAVAIPVVNGLYSVLLGDTTLLNMSAIPLTVFTNTDVRLRVWFNNGVNGFQMLSPDQRIAAVGYALMAANVPDRSITSAKLGIGAVNTTNLANGAITAAKLAPGTVATALGTDLNIGTNGVCGRVDVYSTDIGTPGVTLDGCKSEITAMIQANGEVGASLTAEPWGGVLSLRNERTNVALFAGSSVAGAGSLTVFNEDEASTIYLAGDISGAGRVNVGGTNGTRVSLRGRGTNDYGEILLYNDRGRATIDLQAAEGSGQGGQILLYNTNGVNTVQIDGDDGGHGGWIGLYNQDGVNTIQLDANASGGSRVTTQVLEITGGSDLSENFDINTLAGEIKPGLIVTIDTLNPGALAVSRKAYDRTVAGIVSGANGIKTGMVMGQRGSVADGKHPIALTGRVYCWVDADAGGTIEPGDLLTTSSTPGHGMKASDATRAHGAIIGKAMTSLASGQGLVLVLVSLQ